MEQVEKAILENYQKVCTDLMEQSFGCYNMEQRGVFICFNKKKEDGSKLAIEVACDFFRYLLALVECCFKNETTCEDRLSEVKYKIKDISYELDFEIKRMLKHSFRGGLEVLPSYFMTARAEYIDELRQSFEILVLNIKDVGDGLKKAVGDISCEVEKIFIEKIEMLIACPEGDLGAEWASFSDLEQTCIAWYCGLKVADEIEVLPIELGGYFAMVDNKNKQASVIDPLRGIFRISYIEGFPAAARIIIKQGKTSVPLSKEDQQSIKIVAKKLTNPHFQPGRTSGHAKLEGDGRILVERACHPTGSMQEFLSMRSGDIWTYVEPKLRSKGIGDVWMYVGERALFIDESFQLYSFLISELLYQVMLKKVLVEVSRYSQAAPLKCDLTETLSQRDMIENSVSVQAPGNS